MTVPIDYVYKHKTRTFSSTIYSAALRFTINGKEYHTHFDIDKDTFVSYSPGDSVQIEVPLAFPPFASLVEKKLIKANP